MRCIDCQHMTSDKNPHAAQAGLVRCAAVQAPAGYYKTSTYQRDCRTFAQADDAVIEKRVAWFKKYEWSENHDSAGN